MTYEEIVQFHGHECPGLAIGYKMATAAMDTLKTLRAADEELVAIVENSACGVDALQCVTGRTFGKGNLLFRNYGKQVYTIYSRSSWSGVRVLFHGKGIPEGLEENRSDFTKWILSASNDIILSVTPITILEPEPARIRKSIPCAFCGESVMESLIQKIQEKPACIPCFEKQQKLEQDALANADKPLC
jgi:formylmethanofuran dehydrogenase subunit E